jgi:hypothetical protein
MKQANVKMNKPIIKQRLRETTEALLQLHESESLYDWAEDILRRSIINLELAKMELNK